MRPAEPAARFTGGRSPSDKSQDKRARGQKGCSLYREVLFRRSSHSSYEYWGHVIPCLDR